MEGTPPGIDVDEVRHAILSVPGVCEVHDLHVWTITSGMVALSAHVAVPGDSSRPQLLAGIRELLDHRFGIDHVTIQVEGADESDPDRCSESARHP